MSTAHRAPDTTAALQASEGTECDQTLSVVQEYTRLGVGALDLLERMVAQAGSRDELRDLGRTIAHLKSIYVGLERRHRAAVGCAPRD